MKKRILSIVLTLCLAMTFLPFAVQNVKAETGKKITDYSVDDTLEFGYYPQSKVEDEAIIDTLNQRAGVDLSDIATSTSVANGWTSYGYYSGEARRFTGTMVSGDYMRYIDVVYGDSRYRGVVFDAYRPAFTESNHSANSSFQGVSGYYPGAVYWFKYEPITWYVLDAANGLVMSKYLLDSQAYHNYIYFYEIDAKNYYYYGDPEKTYLANNYETSDIRKWLNDDFLNTAFTASQREIIKATKLDDSYKTDDKIFLLSRSDVLNSSYHFGFSQYPDEYNHARCAFGTDYAKCQGLDLDRENASFLGGSEYYLRDAYIVDSMGIVDTEENTDCTATGIRISFKFNTDANIIQPCVTSVGYCKSGEKLEFGYYPQSKVTDETTVNKLNKLAKVDTTSTETITASTSLENGWVSYGYYSGNDNFFSGEATVGDWMRYIDIVYGGNKYRGVVFDNYRPHLSEEIGSYETSNQGYNGYIKDTVYWFKYESVIWRVLNGATGMVMSETILDSQAYNEYILCYGTDVYGNTAYWGDSGKNYYVNNYEHSSIREWLNDDFYNTAFSVSQKEIIATTVVDNSAFDSKYSKFGSTATDDKIYLLSWSEAQNENYGFVSSKNSSAKREKQSTDYAKIQGLTVDKSDDYYSNSAWRLRSAGELCDSVCAVDVNGYIGTGAATNNADIGIVPVMNFEADVQIIQEPIVQESSSEETTNKTITEYDVGDTLEFGYYPQSKVTDESVISSLNALAMVDFSDIATSTSVANGWTSYGYYSELTASDYMRYKDVIYDGNKYRGVIFDSYRPVNTINKASAYTSNSSQDDNGYVIANVYWFKYDPITWRVLDPATGMVMSETILDSQAFNNYQSLSDGVVYGDADKTYAANNYEKSSIRKWLNDDFYSTAFSSVQEDMITATDLEMEKDDRIYLLSWFNAVSEVFESTDDTDAGAVRRAQGSDYAKSQGLSVSPEGDYSGNAAWLLRSVGYKNCLYGIYFGGTIGDSFRTYRIDYGIRPVFNFNTTSEIVQYPVTSLGYYQTGNTLEYGWYPQSRVTDTDLLKKLNNYVGVDDASVAAIEESTSVANGWNSYGYYSGSGGDGFVGSMVAGDWMRHIDIVYDDGNKYRGVVFDLYRPKITGETHTDSDSYQDDNGYGKSTVYWFKYEPITWRVLDPATGLLISETILDSQAFNNCIIAKDGGYYGESDDGFANNYEYSSIRKWLNDDFYNTVFSSSQKDMITAKNLEMKDDDRIYLLSESESKSKNYAFAGKAIRTAQGSDYAKSQGLSVSSNYGGNSCWRLRSTGNDTYYTCDISFDGIVSSSYRTDNTFLGVRPALNLNPILAFSQSDVTEVGATYTVETYLMNSDGTYGEECSSSKTLYSIAGKAVNANYTIPENYVLDEEKSTTSGTVTQDNSLILKVYLKIDSYVLTTIVDGVSTPYTFTYGQTISGIEAPTKTGYTFAGWTPEIPATMPADDMTITATWEVNYYDATFVVDGKENKVSTAFGQVPVAPDATKVGYRFTGWDKELVAMVVGGATYVAQFEALTYDATFDANGGAWADGARTKVVPTTFDTAIVAPEADPEREGYIFAGWSPEVGVMNAEGILFTAQWTQNLNYCRVQSVKRINPTDDKYYSVGKALYEIKVMGSPVCVQIASAENIGVTWTYSRENDLNGTMDLLTTGLAEIKAYNAEGNEVALGSEETAYEIWKAVATIKEGSYKVRAKVEYSSESWESLDFAYDYTVVYAEKPADTSAEMVKSAAAEKASIIRGEYMNFNIVTDISVKRLRFTRPNNDGTLTVMSFADSGSMVTITEDAEAGTKAWAINIRFTFSGSEDIQDQTWTVWYRANSDVTWTETDKTIAVRILRYAEELLNASNEVISVTNDATASTKAYTEIVIVTSDDVSKVRIKNTGTGKSSTYTATSNNITRVDNGDGTATWTIKYKFTATGEQTWVAQVRGTSWSEVTDASTFTITVA